MPFEVIDYGSAAPFLRKAGLRGVEKLADVKCSFLTRGGLIAVGNPSRHLTHHLTCGCVSRQFGRVKPGLTNKFGETERSEITVP
jgi:hypothetical protein